MPSCRAISTKVSPQNEKLHNLPFALARSPGALSLQE
jgi:hypothetical protein